MKRLLLFLLLFMWTAPSHAVSTENISGEIRSGYRILEVNPISQDNHLTVYRGDYIKFSYPTEFASLTFKITELQYSSLLSPTPAESPFFKMKVTGTYPFILGKAGGSITVIDLIRPNYLELSAGEAAALVSTRQPYVLDVRTLKEYQRVHISGAHLIPIQQLQTRIDELEANRHEDIFIYCATGNRSTVASRILIDQGFKRIYNLRYGIHDWVRRGHPYKTGN